MDNGALQMMFSNGMQGLGAMQLGAGSAISQQADQAKLKAMQMENDQNAVMNPLNAQFKQGQIAAQQAELPGLMGVSDQQVARGKVATATADSDIAASIAKNTSSIGQSGMQQMGQDANRLGQIGAVLKQFPASAHAQLLPQIAAKYGMSADNPILQQLTSAPDPSFIVPAIDKMASGMAQASQEYLANTGQQEQAQSFKERIDQNDRESKEKIAKGGNEATIEAAKIAAASRVAAADARSKAAMLHMNMGDKIAYISGIPEEDRTPTEQAQLIKLSQQRIAERTAPSNSVPNVILNQPTNQDRGNATANDIWGSGGGAKPSDQLAAQSQIAQMAQKQGLAYEPDKYDYAVINGVLKRRPK